MNRHKPLPKIIDLSKQPAHKRVSSEDAAASAPRQPGRYPTVSPAADPQPAVSARPQVQPLSAQSQLGFLPNYLNANAISTLQQIVMQKLSLRRLESREIKPTTEALEQGPALTRNYSAARLLKPPSELDVLPRTSFNSPNRHTLGKDSGLPLLKCPSFKLVKNLPLAKQIQPRDEKQGDLQKTMLSTTYSKPKLILRKQSQKALHQASGNFFQTCKDSWKREPTLGKAERLEEDTLVRMPLSCRMYQERTIRHQCSVQTLEEVTGMTEPLFHLVRRVELRFDFNRGDLLDLHSLLPNLVELNIADSNLQSLRDLGVGLMSLRVLWVNRNNLTSLDAVNCFQRLTELYASYNRISDILSLAYHPSLKILDLEGNELSSLKSLDTLATLSLEKLQLEGNPICQETVYSQKLDSSGLLELVDLQDHADSSSRFQEQHQDLLQCLMKSGLFSDQKEITEGIQKDEEEDQLIISRHLKRRIEKGRRDEFGGKDEYNPFDWVDNHSVANPFLRIFKPAEERGAQGEAEDQLEEAQVDEDLIRQLNELGAKEEGETGARKLAGWLNSNAGSKLSRIKSGLL